MKLDQIAYYAHNEAQARYLKRSFGLEDAEWISDHATGAVTVYRPDGRSIEGESVGLLQFNYDLGIELEILTYLSGPHWHEAKSDFMNGAPFISHIGFHMAPGEGVPEQDAGTLRLEQVMETKSHTNAYLIEKGRTYHYEIYSAQFGPDLKYIWRKEG